MYKYHIWLACLQTLYFSIKQQIFFSRNIREKSVDRPPTSLVCVLLYTFYDLSVRRKSIATETSKSAMVNFVFFLCLISTFPVAQEALVLILPQIKIISQSENQLNKEQCHTNKNDKSLILCHSVFWGKGLFSIKQTGMQTFITSKTKL